MKTNKIQWKRISEGEALPCDSLLMRYDGTITRGTCAGVKAGQDAYYLPLDELKKLPKEESEDKKMIQYFEDLAPFHEAEELYEKYGFSHKEAIAWIEKQCEHKKFLDSIQVGDKVTRNEDGVLVNLSQLNRVAKKDEKQGGQRTKLVDFDLNAKDSDLQEATYFIPNGFHAEIIGDKVVIKKGEQKPWSEDDEYMLNLICENIPYSLGGRMWLKTLKDRVVAQPKQEWSEEDEKMINSIAVHLNATTCGFPEDRAWADRFMNWLKSLKGKYTWKPSERKIQSVADCTLNKNIDADTRLVLDELYQDLLKLR